MSETDTSMDSGADTGATNFGPGRARLDLWIRAPFPNSYDQVDPSQLRRLGDDRGPDVQRLVRRLELPGTFRYYNGNPLAAIDHPVIDGKAWCDMHAEVWVHEFVEAFFDGYGKEDWVRRRIGPEYADMVFDEQDQFYRPDFKTKKPRGSVMVFGRVGNALAQIILYAGSPSPSVVCPEGTNVFSSDDKLANAELEPDVVALWRALDKRRLRVCGCDGRSGSGVPATFTVKVEDEGKPLVGARVSFRITAGLGYLAHKFAVLNRAQSKWETQPRPLDCDPIRDDTLVTDGNGEVCIRLFLDYRKMVASGPAFPGSDTPCRLSLTAATQKHAPQDDSYVEASATIELTSAAFIYGIAYVSPDGVQRSYRQLPLVETRVGDQPRPPGIPVDPLTRHDVVEPSQRLLSEAIRLNDTPTVPPADSDAFLIAVTNPANFRIDARTAIPRGATIAVHMMWLDGTLGIYQVGNREPSAPQPPLLEPATQPPRHDEPPQMQPPPLVPRVGAAAQPEPSVLIARLTGGPGDWRLSNEAIINKCLATIAIEAIVLAALADFLALSLATRHVLDAGEATMATLGVVKAYTEIECRNARLTLIQDSDAAPVPR